MKTPAPEAIRAFMKRHDLTGTRAAELAGLKNSAAIRKYTGGQKPYSMSEAMWFTLHARLLLPNDVLDRIHKEMDKNADSKDE